MASKQAQRLAARQQLQQRMAAKAAEERHKRTVAWSVGGVAALAALVLVAWGTFAYVNREEEAAPLDPDVSELVNDAEAASTRCDGVEPSGDGELHEATEGSTDGQPAQDVYLECMQMSTPDASKTESCTYTATAEGNTTPNSEQPAAGTQTMTIVTNLGTITAEIETSEAPCTAGSFTYLAQDGYFDGQQCHRLTTDSIWVLQCGDPDAREQIEAGTPENAGSGTPGYQYGEENLPVEAENNYPAGTLAMANGGADTTGSQLFIVYEDTSLSADYTILGQITEGMDIIEQVADAGAM